MGLKKFLIERKKKKFRKKHKIGLCLSGGGTRGISYIGAFKAFEDYGITFDAVAGASAGSLFGALYASGMTSDEMMKKASKVKTSDFRKAKLGFLPSKMDNLQETLSKAFPNDIKRIEDLKIPYYAVAVDLRTGKEIHFSSGDLCTVISGSCAIPGVFYPVKYKGMTLIDGGVSNNIPVDVLKDNGCDYVVTIDCNSSRGGGTTSESLITQFITSVGIMMVNNSKQGIKLSDVLIMPKLENFKSLKMENLEYAIKQGYKAVVEAMPEIQKLFMGKIKK